MKRLQGKVAIVLGAAGENNLGQVIARRYTQEGAKVVVAGRDEKPLAALAAEIGGAYELCDITRKDDVDRLVAETLKKFGAVDVGVNATGWGLVRKFEETTTDELVQMTALQFIGPFQFFQALIGGMRQGGSIIQISSATAKIMLEDHAAYMGTKAGIDHVIRCIANEFGVRNIRANSISPGFTVSPMTARAARNSAVVEAFRREYPLGRIGTLDDTAEAAVWLASDACFLTGENLQINGGLTLRRNPTNQEIIAAVAAAREGRQTTAAASGRTDP
jgi:2-hydroxycyclohexanecarboxyl-CoA dehydrogenase